MKDRVTEYARLVVSGVRVACQLHRLACQRHLSNLEKQNTKDFPYYWDIEASERVLEYAETLTISEGEEPRPVRLIGSQIFSLGCTFGWMKSGTHYRRFRRRYKSIARQNGKTFENGIMGTYIAGFSGYMHGKLFTAATKKRQARLAWEQMKQFISADADLGAFFEIKDYKSMIEAKNTHCTIEALSREGGLDDGFRSIFASIDELHQHKDNKVYKAIYNGTRKLKETLVSMITTRGDNLRSWCKEMDDYAVGILRGDYTAEDFFVDIHCLDDGDDIWDPANYIKANPIFEIDHDAYETMLHDAQTAKDSGGDDLKDFVIKCCNLWIRHADNRYLHPDHWKACGTSRSLADIVQAGYTRCFVGLDLSSGGDLTTLVLLFPLGEGRFYIYSHSFMPYGRMQEHIETDLAPYDLWEQNGLMTVTGGESDYMTDYKFILSHLAALRDQYGLQYQAIGYDPHNAAGILSDLEAFGCPIVSITQSARNLDDATVAVRLLCKGHQLEYDNSNELLTWSMLNAVTVQNSFGEIKIDKKPGAKFRRIDPCDAVIDAYKVQLVTGSGAGGTAENLNDALAEYLTAMGWAERS
ncbi:MAG: terminase large subunit [Oscillospiraceae bacterium]|nr:terminase large subunit [Oscillospiraceae bacterium]